MRSLSRIVAVALVCIAVGGCQESASKAPSSAASNPGSKKSTPIDLLAQIDPTRDQIRGAFKREGESLIVPSHQGAKLAIPVDPPAEYRLFVEVERTSGYGSFNLGLVIGDHATTLVLEGWNLKLSGLSLVDGQTPQRNPTAYRVPLFPTDRPIVLECTVLARDVFVRCDRERIVEWSGDPARLSRSDDDPQSTGRLTIGGWDAEFRITRLELTPL
jgi:hypothetical protein